MVTPRRPAVTPGSPVVVLLLAGAIGCAAPEQLVVRDRTAERCAARPPGVTFVEQTAVDEHSRIVAVRVDGDVVRASMRGTLKPPPPSAVPPVPLPNRPFVDAPAHGPRPFFQEFIASSVAGLINVTILSWLPGVPFIELPLSKPVGTLFDDYVLERDEWRAEVDRRAERFHAAERARDAREAPLRNLATMCEGPCVLRGLIDAQAQSVMVEVYRDSCDVRVVELAIPPMGLVEPAPPTPPVDAPARATVPDDTDPKDAAARAQERMWTALEKDAPPWARPFPDGCCASSAFTASKQRHVGALDGETLVCHVRVKNPGAYDWLGQPDLLVRIAMGYASAAARTFVAPEERGTYTWLLPGVHLLVGEKVKLSLVDDDVGNDEWIGAVVQTFDGVMPMRFEHRAFEGECRVRPRDEEGRWRARAARTADGAIRGLLRRSDASRPVSVDAKIRALLADVASAGGWSTSEAKALRNQYQTLRDEWRRQRGQVMKRATDQGVVVGLQLRPVSDVDCSGGFGCRFRIEVTSRTRTRAIGAKLKRARLSLVDGIGRSATISQNFLDAADKVVLDPEIPQRFALEAVLPGDEPPYSLELPNGGILELTSPRRVVTPHQ